MHVMFRSCLVETTKSPRRAWNFAQLHRRQRKAETETIRKMGVKEEGWWNGGMWIWVDNSGADADQLSGLEWEREVALLNSPVSSRCVPCCSC